MEETKSEKHPRRTILIIYAVVTLVFLLTVSGFAWVVLDVLDLEKQNKNLGKENHNRISEIQQSRVDSCKGTYRGIKEVFKPFFPAAPRTNEQQADLDKFNQTINRLQKGCVKQTKAKVGHK